MASNGKMRGRSRPSRSTYPKRRPDLHHWNRRRFVYRLLKRPKAEGCGDVPRQKRWPLGHAIKTKIHDVSWISFRVALSRFELLTSCLSSRRSKPAELKDRFGTANIAQKEMRLFVEAVTNGTEVPVGLKDGNRYCRNVGALRRCKNPAIIQ